MRYIKFRAWNVITKTMVCPHKLTPLALHPDCLEMEGVFLPFHDNLVLMQYTGLEDKNGVEIYEGDVVDWLGDKFKIIIYCATAWCVTETSQQSLYEIDDTEIEIIGNIYENPELLPE